MRLAICCIFRNETLYLREWLEFHILMGVEKFHLYQNRSEDNWQSLLQPYMDRGIVELIDWPHIPPCQVEAYQDCINRQRGQKEWIAFIDCDEFLWSPKYATLAQAMATFPEHWGAIGVNWMCFGSSDRQQWEDALVLERFVWRPVEESFFNRHIKSLVRMDQDARSSGDPHYFHTQYGTFNEDGEGIGAPESHQKSRAIRINHYPTKSRQEWVTRNKTGKPNWANFVGDENIYNVFQPKDVEDREIQRYLPALKKRLR